MAMWLETLRLALSSIVENRLRAALTTLGIIFATAAVIAVVAIVNGVFFVFSSQLEEIGAGFLFALSGNSEATDKVRSTARLTPDDAAYLQASVDDVLAVSPFWGEMLTVQQHGKTVQGFLAPVNERYPDIQAHYVEEGRFFTAREERTRARVCVVGPALAEELGLQKALGEQVRIFGAAFTVIGVLEHKDGMNPMGQRFDRMVIVPHATALQFSGPSRGGILLIKLLVSGDTVDVERTQEEVRQALRRSHRLRFGEEDDFTLLSQREILESLSNVSGIATWVVIAIVGVALLVGGIGIMNIMLVSVTERTREIGLRMAVGARREDVLAQFLVEATLLGMTGGAVGIATGFGVARLISATAPNFTAVVAPWSVGLAFVFSLLTGLVFGLYPAMRAARLDPSDALRYE